jgi:hypothetical protein
MSDDFVFCFIQGYLFLPPSSRNLELLHFRAPGQTTVEACNHKAIGPNMKSEGRLLANCRQNIVLQQVSSYLGSPVPSTMGRR